MTELEKYEFKQEYDKFQMLVNTKEYVTKEEYEFIIDYDKTEKGNFFYIGDYLNLNVYSEHDHEKRQYEMEVGI